MRIVLLTLLAACYVAPSYARGAHHRHHAAHHRAHHAVAHARRSPRPVHEAAHAGNVIAALDAKVAELTADCGARVISGYRPGARVAGTGRVSEHAYGHARDVRGNYACIYRHLAGWTGGYSTDPGRVGHVHVSLGGPEDGRRFRHRGYASGGAHAYRAILYTRHWRHWRRSWWVINRRYAMPAKFEDMVDAIDGTSDPFQLAGDLQVFKDGLRDLRDRLQALEARADTPPAPPPAA